MNFSCAFPKRDEFRERRARPGLPNLPPHPGSSPAFAKLHGVFDRKQTRMSQAYPDEARVIRHLPTDMTP